MNPTRTTHSATPQGNCLRCLAVATAIVASILTADAQPTNTPSASPLNYSSFQIIAQRNIFNPNRRGGRVASFRTERRVRTDSFALRGTLLYNKGDFAFFDGSGPDFKKVCDPTDTTRNQIAGYTVKAVTLNSVTLEIDGKPLEMKVGSQMQREENGPWRLVAASEWAPTPIETPAAESKDSGDSASPGTEGNDTLRKLMEQRQREQESK